MRERPNWKWVWCWFLGVVVLAMLVGGCSGVILNAEYSQLLDRTAALSADTAKRADANALTPDQMKQALRGQSEVWQRFVDARDGTDGNGSRP